MRDQKYLEDKEKKITEKEAVELFQTEFDVNLNDFNFFKQTINRFNNCEIFNYSLGMFLSKCSWCDLERITADCLIIDQYKTGMLQKDKLLTAFNKNNINKRKYNFFILLIFNHDNYASSTQQKTIRCFYTEWLYHSSKHFTSISFTKITAAL